MAIFQRPIICSSWNSTPFSPFSHTIQAFLDAPLLTFHLLGEETQRSLNYRQNGQAIIEAVDYVARVTAPLVGVGGIMPTYSYLSLINKHLFQQPWYHSEVEVFFLAASSELDLSRQQTFHKYLWTASQINSTQLKLLKLAPKEAQVSIKGAN